MRRRLFLAIIAILGFTSRGFSQSHRILSAAEANALMQDGQLVILDIRRRAEWLQTGVAKGAIPMSMHEADFPARLSELLQTTRPENIGLICATGQRTAHVVGILAQNGISGVADISEGMKGNARGSGWIKGGLPIVSLEDALAANN